MLPDNLLHPLKLDVVGFKEEDHDYHFRVELPEPSCCQSCGYADEKPGKYGKDDQAYRDVPIHGKRCTIWMIRRRYVCKACGSTFRPELKDMDDRRMMTKRLVKHIEVAAVLGSNSEVARTVGVDEKTKEQIMSIKSMASQIKRIYNRHPLIETIVLLGGNAVCLYIAWKILSTHVLFKYVGTNPPAFIALVLLSIIFCIYIGREAGLFAKSDLNIPTARLEAATETLAAYIGYLSSEINIELGKSEPNLGRIEALKRELDIVWSERRLLTPDNTNIINRALYVYAPLLKPMQGCAS
jgi:hypothetical protein